MRLSQDIVNRIYQDRATTSREKTALELARAGMHIHPLIAGGKTPILKGWEQKATTSPSQISEWFAKFPDCNYGIACGPSGLIVVDLDVKNEIDGITNWEHLARPLSLPKSFEVLTPSNGKHIYWWGHGVRNSAGKVADAIDIRGEGGYVVGPESKTSQGTYSAGLEKGIPDVQKLQPAPETLKYLLNSPKAREIAKEHGVLTVPDIPVSTQSEPLGLEGQFVALQTELNRVASAPEGTRNDALVKASFALGQLANDSSLPVAGLTAALRNAAKQAGLDDYEIGRTINSGFSQGRLNPRETIESVKVNAYEPLDLKLWFDSDHAPPEHFARGQVLYKGGLTWLSGEPESGKSFIALAWALDVVKSGYSVVWLDEEAGPRDTLAKLQALGGTPAELEGKFHYLPPQARDLSKTAIEFLKLTKSVECGLVVIDSAAAILANAGIDEDKNSQVTGLVNKAILPLSKELEIATIVIDHKSKSNTESRYSRGASAKLGIVDLALNVSTSKPFSRGSSGAIDIKVMKDRWGDFGRNASWRVDANATGDEVEMLFHDLARVENTVQRSADAEVTRAERVERVRSIVQSAYPEPLSRESIARQLTGVGSEKSREAITEALNQGLITHSDKSSGGQPMITIPSSIPELF